MLVTALFLLVRNNYVSYRLMSLRTLGLGNWLIFVFHIVVFAPMDRYFLVNVQFFLCPSEGKKLPPTAITITTPIPLLTTETMTVTTTPSSVNMHALFVITNM